MAPRAAGLLVIGLGVAAVIVGLLLLSGAFAWFGRLPGDIRIQGEHMRIYIPITSMLLVSLAVTLLYNLLRRVFY
jgi:hypothetical protein